MAVQHSSYNTTLGELVGRCRALKPNCAPTVLQGFANDRVRTCLDRQPYWSGLIDETILYIPASVTGGSVSFTKNSTTVTGTGTTWPIDDVVNTTLPDGVIRTGYQIVTPASMDGITADSYLYVDGDGDPEIVHVIELRPTSFVAIFQKFHNPGCAVTSSSYCGRQLRLGNTFPIFTIEAIVSATEMIVDMAWRADDLTDHDYSIWQMYYTISPDIKSLLAVVDQAQGLPPLRVNVPILELNRIDPQRSSTGYPQIIANKGINSNNCMQWEIWPRCPTERQLRVTYFKQPAKMMSEGDLVPAFMNPTVLFHGMMADAYRTKITPDDPYFNPALSADYERRFEDGFASMSLQDDDFLLQRYGNRGQGSGFGGANFAKDHDYSVYDGWYWP
jgi:hypothetical protein